MQFYKTRLVIEVEVETQFGPESAMNLIIARLQCPAVTDITMLSGETNYQVHLPPSQEFYKLMF